NAETNGPGTVTQYSPFGADGYPAIDQVTGDVFQAAGFQNSDGSFNLLLNIGKPDSSGNLTFLDAPDTGNPTGDPSNLIHIVDHLRASPDTLFTVLSMDAARNLHVCWLVQSPGSSPGPGDWQVFVSAASTASGWRRWSTPVQVS